MWIDHLRQGDSELAIHLLRLEVVVHPFVTGEIALGSLRDRRAVLAEFERLPKAPVEADRFVRAFIEDHALGGTGIG